jgi:hypothetical protein
MSIWTESMMAVMSRAQWNSSRRAGKITEKEYRLP